MTSEGFTPGPWYVVGRADEYTLYVGAERPGNAARLDSVLSGENVEANAHLIAAALTPPTEVKHDGTEEVKG
jgi:hypothetical protein